MIDLAALIPPLEDSISFISWIVILLCFIAFLSYLIASYSKFRSFFRKNDVISLLTSERLESVLFDYNNNLMDFKNELKSKSRFEESLDKSSLVKLFFNDKLLGSASNILVGLGILGTFIGLTTGISGFNMDDSDTMRASIKSLIDGMDTAFLSSVWGMALSLLFTLIFQIVRHKITKIVDRFVFQVDKTHLLNQQEVFLIENRRLEESIGNVIENYFVNTIEGKKRKPKYYYRELLLNSSNQTAALGSMADDFASKLSDVLEEIMNTLLEQNIKAFADIIKNELFPVLENIKEMKQEGIKGVLEKLESSISEMVKTLEKSISDGLKGEMKELATQLQNILTGLKDMPKASEEMAGQLDKLMLGVEKLVSRLAVKVGAQAAGIGEKTNDIVASIDTSISTIINRVEDLSNGQEHLANTIGMVVEEANNLVVNNKQGLELFGDVLAESQDTVKTLKETSDYFNTAAKSLNIGAESVEQNNTKVLEAVDKFVSANSKSIDEIRALQEKVSQQTGDLIQEFETLQSSVKKTFENVNDGLGAYTDGLNDSLSTTIGNYADSSKGAIEAINSLASELNDSIESLSETLSKAVNI
jgi:methyl-accepting chemotaxis protein